MKRVALSGLLDLTIPEKYRLAITVTFFYRVGLGVWLALIWVLVDRYLAPLIFVQAKEVYGIIPPQPTLLGRAFLDVWLRWDAVHYMNIASAGYQGVGPGDYNFPPLYPYLAMGLKRLTFNNVTFAGLTVSTIAAFIALVLLYQMVIDYFQDEALARKSILILGIYPTAFFLFAPFTDSLFLCLTIAFFLAVRQEKWILAGVLASLAGVTRLQGLLLLVPLVIAALQKKSISLSHIRPEVLLAILVTPLGFGIFSLWRISQNILSLSNSFREYSNIVFVDPFTGLLLAVKQVFETGNLLPLSELVSVCLFGSVLVWMLFQDSFRSQLPLMTYSIAMLILFLSKHSVAASALQSSNRYVLSIFPVFIGIAAIMSGLPKWGRKIIQFASISLLFIASALYALGIFIG